MSSKPPHIGIVEDDSDGAELIALRMTREGYRASMVHDAEAALHRFQSDPADLLLLDYCLPGGQTGLDLYERIREIQLATPAILITGYTDGEVLLEAWRRGLSDVVVKSVRFLDELVDRVRHTLAAAEAERRRAANQAVRSAIIDSAPMALIASDEQERIILINHAAERLLLCTADQVAGRRLTELLPATVIEGLCSTRSPAPAVGPLSCMVRRVDGEDVTVEIECWQAATERGLVRILLLELAKVPSPAQASGCIAE